MKFDPRRATIEVSVKKLDNREEHPVLPKWYTSQLFEEQQGLRDALQYDGALVEDLPMRVDVAEGKKDNRGGRGGGRGGGGRGGYEGGRGGGRPYDDRGPPRGDDRRGGGYGGRDGGRFSIKEMKVK